MTWWQRPFTTPQAAGPGYPGGGGEFGWDATHPRVEVAQGVCPVCCPEEGDEGAVAGELQRSGHPADGLGFRQQLHGPQQSPLLAPGLDSSCRSLRMKMRPMVLSLAPTRSASRLADPGRAPALFTSCSQPGRPSDGGGNCQDSRGAA